MKGVGVLFIVISLVCSTWCDQTSSKFLLSSVSSTLSVAQARVSFCVLLCSRIALFQGPE